MSYIGPIETIYSRMETNLNTAFENKVFEAVAKVGVHVDKDELLKALQYDRDQYQKGYADRDSEVVRCKDCKWYKEGYNIDGKWFSRCNGSVRTYGHTSPDWFCADGERREL